MKDDKKNYNFLIVIIVLCVAIVAIVGMLKQGGVYGTASDSNLGGAAASTSKCTDSDGGKNYYVKGTALAGRSSSTDYCLSDGNRLIEYYCSNNKIYSVNYICSTEGKICKDGACVIQNWCNDTDGGRNYYTFGTVYTNLGSYADTCFNGSILKEGFCGNNTYQYELYACPFGCLGGVCADCRYDTDCREIACPDGSFVHEVCDTNTGKCFLKTQCPTLITETDTCNFINYFNHTNYCYSNKGNCSGYGSCNAVVIGTSGEQLTWNSNCLGTYTTIIDGMNENIYFNCTS